jgi:hypothetical protein
MSRRWAAAEISAALRICLISAALLRKPHLVQDRLDGHEGLGRVGTGAGIGPHPIDPAHDAGIERRVDPNRKVQTSTPVDQGRHDLVEIAQRKRLVGPEIGRRALHADPRAIPLLTLGIARPTEDHEIALVPPRSKDGEGVGLGEARQIHEVAVLTERIVDVAIAHGLAGGRNDGDAVGADRLGEGAATALVLARRHGFGEAARATTCSW